MTAIDIAAGSVVTVTEVLSRENEVTEATWKQLKAAGLVWTGKNITIEPRDGDLKLLEVLMAEHGAERIMLGSAFNLCSGAPVDKWTCARSVHYWPR